MDFTGYGPAGGIICAAVVITAAFLKYLAKKDADQSTITEKVIDALTESSAALETLRLEVERDREARNQRIEALEKSIGRSFQNMRRDLERHDGKG